MLPINDPVQVFATVLAIVLIAPLVFERLRIPGIIGLIVAGILIGPYALNVLQREGPLELLGEVGLLYIMFVAGLEIDLNQFARQRSHSVVFGAFTFFIPLFLGTALGWYYLGMPLHASVLLATMFSSHTLVTYPIASRLGLSKEPAVTTTIGGTLITDTAALLVLAVIAGMTVGVIDAWFWVRMLTSMTVYVLGVFILLPRIGRWFFHRIGSEGTTEYIFVLTAVFLCAWLAHVAGLEPIIGAFLAGLLLNRYIPERSVLMNRIQFVGDSLFIPFFLITVGMLVDLRLLIVGVDAWRFAISMLGCAILAKWLAAMFTRWILKYNLQEANLVFGLSVNQAAATLAAVMVGYRLELFDEAILTGTIFMIMGTCFLGPWVTEAAARRVALGAERKPYDPAGAPQRIMVPLANPETANRLMSLACMLRPGNSREPVYPLTAIVEGDDTEARVAEGEKLLGKALVDAIAANVPVVPVTRVDINVPSAILSAMRDYRISMVITGWDGKKTSRQRIYGRVLDDLLEKSRQMLVVASFEAPLNTTKRVLLVLPPLAERHVGLETELHTVKTMAQQLGADLTVVTTSDALTIILPVLEKTRPQMRVETNAIDQWSSLIPFLKRTLREGDLTVMMSVRKGQLAWQPALDRLPALLHKDLPVRDFLVLYPPESRQDTQRDAPVPIPAPVVAQLLPPERTRLDFDDTSFQDAIRMLLQESLGSGTAALERLTQRLIVIGREEPVELAPGAVLLHTHTADVAVPAVHLGVNHSGFDIPHTTQTPKILLLLLSPRNQPPEIHLQMLAMIARWIRRPQAIETICAADQFADLPPMTLPPDAKLAKAVDRS